MIRQELSVEKSGNKKIEREEGENFLSTAWHLDNSFSI